MPATAARRNDTHDRLLEVALEVFAERGFAGTTVSEIERRVGLAAGTGSFYRHFPSKEALLQEAVEREISVWREWRANLETADAATGADTTSVEHQRQVYSQVLHDLRRFDRLFWLMLAEGDRFPEMRSVISNAIRPPRPGPGNRRTTAETVAMAALGGYHLFSTMQDGPFNGVEEGEFVDALVEIARHLPAKSRR